jgi:hypothetical protein
MLREKEDKKKLELEEKKRKKEEREQKKKDKEAQKKAQKDKKVATRKRQGDTQSKSSKKQKIQSSIREISQSLASSDTNINDSECCECLCSYDDDVRDCTGAEWLQCSCGRWLHEECVDRVDHDSNGNELLCSYCLTNI